MTQSYIECDEFFSSFTLSSLADLVALHLDGSKTSRHHRDLGNLAYTVACLHYEVCRLHLDRTVLLCRQEFPGSPIVNGSMLSLLRQVELREGVQSMFGELRSHKPETKKKKKERKKETAHNETTTTKSCVI